ncbi:10152_t:CDS:2 [Dentiscutata erythropus]|uniref:10152_t:CDS:1 n=1 Tax=Dentiscutata erythropus TaxID=1348616 RepID=A0A9N9DPD5_9GLOM|nr:10152_t:CDS:2 [Dentiscutata erythropus]
MDVASCLGFLDWRRDGIREIRFENSGGILGWRYVVSAGLFGRGYIKIFALSFDVAVE